MEMVLCLIAIAVCSVLFMVNFTWDSTDPQQSGIITTIAFIVMRETYPVVLLEGQASRLRKETGNPAYRSKLAL
jgi:hypothetical protein